MNNDNNQLSIWQMILTGHKATASWGINANTLCNIENGFCFRLDGEKYNGWAEITFDELDNCLNIFFRDQNGLKLIESIPTRELIAAMRNHTKEVDENQLEITRKELGFTKL